MNQIQKIAKVLDKEQTDEFLSWLKEELTDIGMTHNELCLSQRPHSHSCDCDCGADEIRDLILEVT